MSSSVTLTTDLPSAAEILEALQAQLVAAAPGVEAAVKEGWVGFRHPTGKSHDAWEAKAVEDSIEVSNPYDYVETVREDGVLQIDVVTEAGANRLVEDLQAGAAEAFGASSGWRRP